LVNLIKKYTDEYTEYMRDESRTIGKAESISFPKSEDEIRAVLRELAPFKTHITVQGARTGLAAGAVPTDGHAMNLGKMNRTLGLRKGEDGRFTAFVQPGVILSQLRKDIDEKRFGTEGWDDESLRALKEFEAAPEQFFPTDPTETSACIGGIDACNASGARSYLYKSARKHVSYVRLILADGSAISLRRGQSFAKGRELSLVKDDGSVLHVPLPSYQMPKTKNASGYYVEDDMDAVDLIVGSDGTLGVITEIGLELLPLPPFIWGVSAFFASEAAAVSFVENLRAAMARHVAAIEYFDGGALDILRVQKKTSAAFAQLPDVPEQANCCVYAELHCESEDEARTRLYELGEILNASGGDEAHTWVARNSRDLEQLQFFRHAVPESVNMMIDKRKQIDPIITKLGADMSVPDERLEDAVALYRAGLKEYNLESATWGHIGDNHLHVNILPRDGSDYKKGKELYAKWARAITDMGGAVSAEHGVGKLKASFLEVMYGRAHIVEMAKMKRAFDPNFIFGRGNLFPADILEEAGA
jgi:D-lactate dehydrogenase (cytochrome)